MIKNLLNADEDPPPGTKVIIEDSIIHPPAEIQNAETSEKQETPENFEIPTDAQFFTKSSETAEETAPPDEDSESIETLMAEIENLEPEDLEQLEKEIGNLPAAEPVAAPPSAGQVEPQTIEAEKRSEMTAAQTTEKISGNESEPTIFQSDYTPPSTAETIRNSSLAWSAGIVLFGAVIFMMIFGWFADLLFGSSPWGLVGGIILGGFIGIIQLFRISSQIYRK